MAILAGAITPILKAHQLNTAASIAEAAARTARAQRDAIIRSLHKTDPKRWTVAALAEGVGISVSLTYKIIHHT